MRTRLPILANLAKNGVDMPKESLLTNRKKFIILAHREHDMSDLESALLIIRHPATICAFLKRSLSVQLHSRNQPNQKLSEQNVWNIVQMEVWTKGVLKKSLMHSGWISRFVGCRRYFLASMRHKKDLLQWPKNLLEFAAVNWNVFVFTDEKWKKKLNLDKLDSLSHY